MHRCRVPTHNPDTKKGLLTLLYSTLLYNAALLRGQQYQLVYSVVYSYVLVE